MQDLKSRSTDFKDSAREQAAALRLHNTELAKQKAEINSELAASGNNSMNGIFNEIENLKKSLPESNYGTFKDVSKPSLEKFSKDMNRDYISKDIEDILMKNNPKFSKNVESLNANYGDQITSAQALGVDPKEFSTARIDASKRVPDLMTKFENAAGDFRSQDALSRLVDQPTDIANIRDTANKMSVNKTLGGESSGLAGIIGKAPINVAHFIGGEINQVSNSELGLAMKKLGNSKLAQKIGEVMNQPNDIRNRSIFVLQQQPWFRNLIKKDEANK